MTGSFGAGSGLVTLMFTDLKGATEMLDRLGDDAFAEINRLHLGVLRDAVRNAGGTEVKSLRDGLMVAFASAVDAVGCAVDMQVAVARYNRRARSRSGEQLGVRVGLHVGEPFRDESDYFGTPVVVARRLCDQAEAGQIMTSQIVRDLVSPRRGFAFSPPRQVQLEGLAEPMSACEVLWVESSPVGLPPALDPRELRELGFVGRAKELARLEESWRAAQAGSRHVVLIAGEPGIGKTTLAGRVATAAHEGGAIVLMGRCDEAALVPFQPFVEAVAWYMQARSLDELKSKLGPQAADLALLVPQLRDRVEELGGTTSSDGESERYRLFEAVAALFAQLGDEAPVVFVIDDLHWADRPTLQLLHHVIRRTVDVPLLVLGTYRDTDLVRTHPLAETLVELRRAELVERLPLRGLAVEEVARLIVPAGDIEPDDTALAHALWEETEGSPLFLREILRHLAETDAVVRDETGRWQARRRIEQLGIPEGIKEVIGRRLSRLSASTNALLTIASVMGREFGVDVLEQLSEEPIDVVLDALDEASAAGVVAEVEDRIGRYAFTHALVREALYEELSLSRRVRLHLRVGQALEALHADDPDPPLAELAHHFVLAAVAGEADKAIDYAWRAGEHDMAGVAYEAASRHYGMALEAAEDAGWPEAEQARFLRAIGRSQWRAGDPRVARATLQRAAEISQRINDADGLARAALGYTGAGIRYYWVELGVVNRTAIELLEDALARLDTSDSHLRARLMACLAQELYFDAGTYDRRDELSASAVEMARRLGDVPTLAYVLNARNLAIIGPGTARERLSNADECLELAERLHDRNLASFGIGHRGQALLELDDAWAGRRELGRLNELVTSFRDPVAFQTLRGAEALVAQLEGRLDDAEALLREAFRWGQEARDPNGFGFFGTAMVFLRRLQGRPDEMIGPAGAVIGIYPPLDWHAHANLASLYAELGDDEAARQELDLIGAPDLSKLQRDFLWLFSICEVGRAAVALGDLGLAEVVHDLIVPFEPLNVTIGPIACAGSTAMCLGLLATALGRHDDAVSHLERAAARHHLNGWPPLATEAETHLAAALLARDREGDRDRAHALLDEAIATAAALGLGSIGRVAYGHRHGVDAAPRRVPVRRRDRARARLVAGGRRVIERLVRDHDDQELATRFGSAVAQRAMFTALARAFQPAMSFGFEGQLGFELRWPATDHDPLPSDWWTVDVRAGKAVAHRARPDAPAVILRMELPDFVRVASGELHAVLALTERRIEVDGDVIIAARIGEMFGAIPPFEVIERGDDGADGDVPGDADVHYGAPPA